MNKEIALIKKQIKELASITKSYLNSYYQGLDELKILRSIQEKLENEAFET